LATNDFAAPCGAAKSSQERFRPWPPTISPRHAARQNRAKSDSAFGHHFFLSHQHAVVADFAAPMMQRRILRRI